MTNTEYKGDTHIVTPEAGLRLDRGLTDALPGLSRNRVKHLINDGLVAAKNGTITDPSYRVKPGDTFKISVPPPEDSVLRGEQIPLNIHYEDDFLLVIDKPAGLTVHHTEDKLAHTVSQLPARAAAQPGNDMLCRFQAQTCHGQSPGGTLLCRNSRAAACPSARS